jgi:hypothetical protein
MNEEQNIELKDRWNFYLGFEFPPEYQHLARPIELMVSGVDLGAENLMPLDEHGNLHHRSGRVVIWLYDDQKNKMMSAIRELQQANIEFSMRISNCGEHGYPELEAYIARGCRLECLQHSMLSYEETHEKIKLKAFEPGRAHDTKAELSGTISNSASKATVMKLLQVSFTNMQHIINTSNK